MYLGGRIVAAHPVPAIPPPSAPHISAPIVVQPAEVRETVPTGQPVTEDHFFIAPKHGQRYIQVGAVNVDIAGRFIEHLRQEKLNPHIAPGPTAGIKRLLIGPFDDIQALNNTKAQLESEGIATFVRQY